MANSMMRVSTPRTPPPLRLRKRKLETTEVDESARARKVKILNFMNPQRNRSATPKYVFSSYYLFTPPTIAPQLSFIGCCGAYP
jgi:hypothetical protein